MGAKVSKDIKIAILAIYLKVTTLIKFRQDFVSIVIPLLADGRRGREDSDQMRPVRAAQQILSGNRSCLEAYTYFILN